MSDLTDLLCDHCHACKSALTTEGAEAMPELCHLVHDADLRSAKLSVMAQILRTMPQRKAIAKEHGLSLANTTLADAFLMGYAIGAAVGRVQGSDRGSN